MELNEPKQKELTISSLLLPREKYEEAAKEYGPSPFTFEIENNNQSMFYFGANHSHDPNDPQYPVLKKYWEDFLVKTKGKDKVILIEGGLRAMEENEEAAIRRGAEGNLITFLAHQENISVACPDLNDKELTEQLPEILREEYVLYRFLSYLDSFHRYPDPKPDFTKSVERWIAYHQKEGDLGDFNVTIDDLKNLYQKILGKEFTEDAKVNDLVNPNKTGTKVNQVARARSDLRDANIASEIVRYWKEGKSIFVVFGSGHLIIEKPALQKLLS